MNAKKPAPPAEGWRNSLGCCWRIRGLGQGSRYVLARGYVSCAGNQFSKNWGKCRHYSTQINMAQAVNAFAFFKTFKEYFLSPSIGKKRALTTENTKITKKNLSSRGAVPKKPYKKWSIKECGG
ncbi:MAG: hypothetical protein HY864_10475 [Chloroflexi bacterium]|nr:hypothetical protein [Chloroflexota bacterium]